MSALVFDEHGAASLDGEWEFFPGDHARSDLDGMRPETISVPGLWEAQGWLELDGVAWYRRRFDLDDPAGFWSLRFAAVMDVTTVWLNGVELGGHDNPFTPFTLDATAAVRGGGNDLAVRVLDPSLEDPEHVRLAHGKQGWANHVFPSRPSLYMTYGGIWQSVELRRHGPVVVTDVFVNGDPDDLRVEVGLRNVGTEAVAATVDVRAVAVAVAEDVRLEGGATERVGFPLGPTRAARWSPRSPALHDLLVDVAVGGAVSDHRSVRFGLRTVRVEGTDVLLNGERYRMRSALVQGFRAEELYAEGDRAAVEEEVRAAAAMGFNTLRLHIKAFDPVYLDVCDELGMLLHCDIPVAEPIAHEELGGPEESDVARRSVEAVRQQIERDRNHPSVILWAVMNELGLDHAEARSWDRYERFARALVAAAREADPTRPVIENDWVEPDPDRVFEGDVLTAHWYGRLHAEYLDKIEAACEKWRDAGRPLFVTEFGDWGLPEMPHLPAPPFWDTRAIYATGLAGTLWPGSVARFVSETHRYQGLSDRLQAEVFRRHDHIGGYCVTELTDVPHELNGLLDLHRRPKPIAVAEMTRANQDVLPILHLDSLVVVAGERVTAALHVANDGPTLAPVEVEVRFGDTSHPLGMEELLSFDTSGLPLEDVLARFPESVWGTRVARLEARRATRVGRVTLEAPRVTGRHDLVVELRSGGTVVAENRYPMHVVAPPRPGGLAVRVVGGGPTADALATLGVDVGGDGPLVVSEDALDAAAGAEARAVLEGGGVAVVLAQSVEAAGDYPVPVAMEAVETKWGSSVFHFTTDHGALPVFPRRNVLVAEDSTIQAHTVVTAVGEGPFPDTPVVIAFKPVPGAMAGTVVGGHAVGDGRLVLCQYRLSEGALRGDAAARAVLTDVLRWACLPRAVLVTDEGVLADGRRVARYSHRREVAR